MIEKGRKENEPHIFCKVGNDMPTMKLQLHEDTLPKAMATGLGATSNNSE